MGVEPPPLWEIQWLPGSGAPVRRLVLTRKGLRRMGAAAALVGVLVLGILGILPLGLRGFFTRFTVDAAKEENHTLKASADVLGDRAAVLAAQVYVMLQRGRRLAWVVGAPPDAWRGGAASPPPAAAGTGPLVDWLAANAGRLDTVSGALAVPPAGLPCPLASLPTGPPVAAARAVEVSHFGVQTSPFTGKPESHHGCTLAAPEREPVLATGAGRIVFAGAARERQANEWTRLGTTVVIDHSGGVWTVYSHLKDTAVRRGQLVARGDVIGRIGQTGWTRVPALYYEVRWPVNGTSRPVDPALFCLTVPLEDLDGRLADPTAGLPDDYARLERLGIK